MAVAEQPSQGHHHHYTALSASEVRGARIAATAIQLVSREDIQRGSTEKE
jgi:hypothetical protein